MTELRIWIGDDGGHAADPEDWSDLMFDLVRGGCECRMDAHPGRAERGAKGAGILIELIVMTSAARTIITALTSYYRARHSRRIKLEYDGKILEVEGYSPPEADREIERFIAGAKRH